MKVKVLLIALLLLAPLTPSISATPPKTGSICSKAGLTKNYNGKEYTCIKSGKKLVWNKGVVIKVATPTKTPTNSPSTSSSSSPSKPSEYFVPWSTKFTTQLMFDQAFESFVTWNKGQTTIPKKHQVLIQTIPNGFAADFLQELKNLDDFSSGIFSQFMKANSVTVVGFDEQWVISQINSSGGHLRNSQGRCNESYGPLMVCMNRDSHLGIVIVNDCKIPKNAVGGCRLDLLPHEYFHLVQLNMAGNIEGAHWNFGDDYSKNSFPHWFVEGSANFVAAAITSVTRNAKYEDSRGVLLFGGPGGSDMSNALIDYEIYRVNSTLRDNLYSYNIGHIATEYMVASMGFQRFLDIWRD